VSFFLSFFSAQARFKTESDTREEHVHRSEGSWESGYVYICSDFLSLATQFVDEYKALNLNKLFFLLLFLSLFLLWTVVVGLLTQRYPAFVRK
jgi:hypothetical protein